MHDPRPDTQSHAIEFDILHIADSALPVGGFAFSSGLEAASKLGLIRSRPGLERYLQDFIVQMGEMEFPFVRAAYANAHSPGDALAHILEEWAATLTSASMQRASLRQGKGLQRWLSTIHPETDIPGLSDWMRAAALSPHYLPIFSIGMARLGLPIDRVLHLFVFMAVRDQISAAVRLGIIGPMDGQLLQRTLQSTSAETLAHSAGLHYMNTFRSCPLIELSQGYHDHLYSRLFQS